MTSRAATSAALRRLAATAFSGSVGPSTTSSKSTFLASSTATDSLTTAVTPSFRGHRSRFSALVARSCCGDERNSNNDDSMATAKHLQRQKMLIHSSAEAATIPHVPPPPPSTRTLSTSTLTSSPPSSSSSSSSSSSPSSTLLHDPIAIPLHPCHQATANAAAAASLAGAAARAAAMAAATATAATATAVASPPVAAAVVEGRKPEAPPTVPSPPRVVAPVVRWQDGGVPLEAKERLLGQKACVVWLTGLPASGKSAVAAALERQLVSRGRATALLDGDNVRHGLCADLGFSPEDRAENVRRVGEAARLLSTGGGGLVAVAALVSPYASHRDAVRASLPPGRFVEVFVDNPLRLCEERDPKGLYRAARTGQIRGMTGLDAPYEVPRGPEVRVSPCDATGGPEAAAAEVVRFLEERGLIPPVERRKKR